jgi:uncharacterized OB-fold protein
MRRISMKLTMEELVRLSTIGLCKKCGRLHAPVRTCEEAKLEEELARKT